MLPIITARESLLAATRHAMGSGTLAEGTADRIMFDWRTVGQVTSGRTSLPPADDLRAMGVDPLKVRRR